MYKSTIQNNIKDYLKDRMKYTICMISDLLKRLDTWGKVFKS